MCFYMVLDSSATNYIGWPLPAFVSLMIDDAKVLHFSPNSKFRTFITCKNLLMEYE